jgi:hypothetical protein
MVFGIDRAVAARFFMPAQCELHERCDGSRAIERWTMLHTYSLRQPMKILKPAPRLAFMETKKRHRRAIDATQARAPRVFSATQHVPAHRAVSASSA